jgi:hypothetical protein
MRAMERDGARDGGARAVGWGDAIARARAAAARVGRDARWGVCAVPSSSVPTRTISRGGRGARRWVVERRVRRGGDGVAMGRREGARGRARAIGLRWRSVWVKKRDRSGG